MVSLKDKALSNWRFSVISHEIHTQSLVKQYLWSMHGVTYLRVRSRIAEAGIIYKKMGACPIRGTGAAIRAKQ